MFAARRAASTCVPARSLREKGQFPKRATTVKLPEITVRRGNLNTTSSRAASHLSNSVNFFSGRRLLSEPMNRASANEVESINPIRHGVSEQTSVYSGRLFSDEFSSFSRTHKNKEIKKCESSRVIRYCQKIISRYLQNSCKLL